jgi:hypothetical protein
LGERFLVDEMMIRWGDKIRNLKVTDLLMGDGTPITFENFCENLNMQIPERKFRVLSLCCSALNTRYHREGTSEQLSESIMETCNKKKRLSRYIRIVFQGEQSDDVSSNLKKFAENTETIIILENSKILNGLWGFKSFDNSMKTFLFKLHNNTLGYNCTVSKYVRNVNKDCTFCVAADSEEETTETPLHLFFDCPYVEPVLKIYIIGCIVPLDRIICPDRIFLWYLIRKTIITRNFF